MACALSQRNKNTENEEIDDPILKLLDKIRSEYCNFKREKEDIINALQITNLNLTKTLNNLNDELNCTYGNANGSPINTDNKRRKTVSSASDSSDVDSAKLFGRITILGSDSDSDLSKASSIDISSVIEKIKSTQNKTTISSDDSDLDSAKLISRINILDRSRSNSDKSIDNDALNVAINDADSIVLDDSEIFFPPTQTTNLQTTPKRKTSESHTKILSPVNKIIIKEQQQTSIKNEITTPPLMKKLQLPKRMKSTIIPTKNNPSTSSTNNENKKPSKLNDGWISKNHINQKTKNNNWNMSFRQPVLKTDGNNLNSSGEVIACSQDVTRKSKKDRNKPNLKHSPKLRQAKIEFDLKIEKKQDLNLSKNEINETFCEDIIGASPTCTNSLTAKDSKLTRTLRKLTRNKSDDDLFVFPMKKSLSNESLTTTTTKSNSKEIYNRPTTSSKKQLTLITPPKNQIKNEPTVEQRIRLQRQFFEHMLTEDSIEGLVTIIDDNDNSTSTRSNKDTTDKKMLDNDSSLFILPSQPDDVIFVDDTDQCDYNLSSMDFMEEMLKDDKETQPLLKRFEAEQIKSLQCTDNNKKSSSSSTITPPQSRLQLPQQNKTKPIIDNDETTLSEIFDDKNDFTTTTSFKIPEEKGFHHDCDECQKHRKYLISQNVPPDEIEKRLRTCKKPQKLHHTPDGFWDPCFREWPTGDPRNEVLIDYRFINKKKEQK